MIKEHEFHTQWWGMPVGLVTAPRFFSRPSAEQAEMLARYAWAEFKSPPSSTPPVWDLLRAAFAQVDTQVNFHVALAAVPEPDDTGPLVLQFADEIPFRLQGGESRPFQYERFWQLPGITPARMDERQVLWANRLIVESPNWCVRAVYGDAVQGWFLARPEKPGLNLTLAMLHREAVVSGALFYQMAMRAFAARGARTGWASFSIRNTAVHNIFSRLGARFKEPTGCWLWARDRTPGRAGG